ncbi:PTS system trehalose-specific EIIBC component [Salinithrix halophila]|uniref:protein-N(pi)-phosphohistidine--sucrose phosphotransferase n=1 Tax=Salinithrix halophila TaxID=1485204 RepID=A0ABV8JKP0_9BACL
MSISRQSVEQIVQGVGGKENISAVTHCITRLRFALKDESKVDKEKLESIDLVKGSFSTNGQFQVVVGQGTVDKVYKILVELTGHTESSKEDVKEAASKNMNVLQRMVKVLADIFIPIVPAIVMAGLLMGINNVLTGPGIFYEGKSVVDLHPQWKDIADMINLMANTAFTFLPALIGWSAMKKFGGSPLLGIVLGLMLVHPDLLNAWGYGEALKKGEVPTWNLFGFEIEKIGYQGQVLPVLFSAYVLAKAEIFLRKRVPDSIQLLVVAPVALLLTGFLAFIVIGPVTFAIGNMITQAFVTVFDQFAAVGGLLYGGLYAVLVMTGMHHTFLAVDLQLISSAGGTFLWPILALSNIAQGSAALAVGFASRDEKMKGLSFPSAISAFLGVTEPAMFAVNLRYRYPFVMGLIGSALAGMVIMILGVKASSIGVGGIPGFLSIFPQNWAAFFLGMGIVLLIPFALTFIYTKIKAGKSK